MKSHIIIITGYLAAGKSTFARRLSEAISVPCIVKDTFKNALCASVDVDSREESSRFSAVTFDAMMYVAERHIETGCPIIIEGNFVPYGVKKTDEAGVIKALIEKYNCRSLTFKFVGGTRILHKRFIERDILPERGQANMMGYEPSYDEFDLWCRNLDGFDLKDSIVMVDTTDFGMVNFEKHIETAREFLRTI
ncbi:MAG: ATP-binding protein [Oscillospiraceae bacterium]|nr:ATP-binding protein [Oscillospiraceae bacterium]